MVGGGGKAVGSSSRKKNGEGAAQQQEPPQKELFWAPAPLTTKSWADVEDDDDDYFATTAPPRPVWGTADEPVKEEEDVEDAVRAALQEIKECKKKEGKNASSTPLKGTTGSVGHNKCLA